MNVSKSKLLITLLLAIGLLLSASPGAASSLSPFTDVADSHWALPHIMKMEMRKIITGYGNNTFRPENNVTQLEAVVMSVRAMGLEGQVNTAPNQATIRNTYNLSTSWNAAGYVSVAIANGLIETDNFFPNTPATRAWVAQLMIRTIDAESELKPARPTGFADDLSIPSWAKGYVALAAEKDIVNGIRNAAGALEFRPNTLVSRAQLATMISRADPFLNQVSNQLPTATVVSVSGQQLSLTEGSGAAASFFVSAAAPIFDARDNSFRRLSLAALKEGDMIRFGKSSTGLINYIEVLDKSRYSGNQAAPVSNFNFTGSIVQHFENNRVLTIKDSSDKLHTFAYAENVKITQSSQSTTARSLQTGTEVRLRVSTANVITDIDIVSATGAITKGEVFSINLEQGIITLEAAGRFSSYKLSDRVVVEVEGVRFPTVRDLQKGDEVELRIKDNLIETVRLIKPFKVLESQGRVVSYTDKILTIRTVDNQLRAFELATNVAIAIQGISRPTANDIRVDDAIKFIVRDGKLTSIEVTSRSFQDWVQGEVVNVNIDRMILTLEDSAKRLQTYKIETHVVLDLDMRNPRLEDVRAGMQVRIRLDRDVVTEISINNMVEGEIENIDRNRMILTLTNETGRTNYRLASDVDIRLIDIRRPDIDDLRKEQFVKLRLSENIVTRIDVRASKTSYIDYVDLGSNRIEIREDRTIRTYEVTSDTRLIIPGISNPRLSDFKEKDLIRMTFLGEALEEVTLIPPSFGYISSIDAQRGRISMQTRSGIQSVSITRDSKIYSSVSNEISLSNLRVNDFIRVIGADSDRVEIVQAREVEGELFSASSAQGRIYFYDASRAYRNLELANQVYIWKDNATFLIGDLRQGQNIVMYIIDNRVVGIRVR